MINIAMTIERAQNVGAQYVALHGQDEWRDRISYDGAALVVPNDLAARVQAIDPDAASGQAMRLAPLIAAEHARRIAQTFAGKRNSILSYAIKLNGLVAVGRDQGRSIGETLSAEQQADVQLIWSLDDWETATIATREVLIAAADEGYADDAHWPPPPAGLTPEWLAAF